MEGERQVGSTPSERRWNFEIFVDWLEMGYKRKGIVKDDPSVFGPGDYSNGIAIIWEREDFGRSWFSRKENP